MAECCEMMEENANSACELHPDRFDCPDALIVRGRSGYGLIIHDGGHSAVAIRYCPWCGTKLSVPKS